MCYVIAPRRHDVPWFMIHVSWFIFHDTCFMIHDSRFMFHDWCFMFHDSCLMIHVSWLMSRIWQHCMTKTLLRYAGRWRDLICSKGSAACQEGCCSSDPQALVRTEQCGSVRYGTAQDRILSSLSTFDCFAFASIILLTRIFDLFLHSSLRCPSFHISFLLN